MFNNFTSIDGINPDSGQVVEDVIGNVKESNILEVEGWKNPYILYPTDYETLPELLIAYQTWWLRIRNMPSTAKKHVAAIKRMANHPVYPIDPWTLVSEQIINHLEYREHVEKAGPHALRNDWKALKSLGNSYGIDLSKIGYIAPSPPPSKTRILPLPGEVKQQIAYKYSKDKVVNKTIQYILTHGYLFGFRPEEFPIQRVDNVRLSDGYIIVIEAKKHYQLRQVFPEIELLIGDRHKSLKNLLKLHDQINPDNPFLYIQPNGKPWTVDYLRKWLCAYVKPVFPDYSMYNMRHWCATARLIKSYTNNNVWDKEDVKDWLGHDDLRTTDDYTRFAKKYYSLASFDWVGAVLRTRIDGQNNSLDQGTPETLYTSVQRTGGDEYGPTGVSTSFLLLKSSMVPSISIFFFFSLGNCFLVSPVGYLQGVGGDWSGDRASYLCLSFCYPDFFSSFSLSPLRFCFGGNA